MNDTIERTGIIREKSLQNKEEYTMLTE